MRVGKKPNVVEAKKTRSCVVRLEKFSKTSPNVSPSTEEKRINRLNTTTTIMGATPKGRRSGASAAASSTSHHEPEKSNNAPIKKRIVGSTTNLSMQTAQQKSSSTTTTITNIRSNQKIKIIPRSNKSTPASTPSRDETPPPTIAAGRSRRAIKPNPKYASEDLVTPKVVRNVATLGSTNRGAGQAGKTRKNSTSSDDFYNRNSEDEFDKNMNEEQNDDDDEDDDLLNDKAYQVNEKDENDSDYSEIDELPARSMKSRGRPKRATQDFSANNLTTSSSNKITTQAANTSSSSSALNQVKRSAASAQHNSSSTNLRSAPSQLQQIRRSLATANAQRNLNMLAGSGATAQKRKLEDTQDSSDNDSSYTITRKQLLLSQAGGVKVKVPVRENSKINATSTPLTKNRVNTPATAQQQTVNGSTSRLNSTQTSTTRRAAEIVGKTNVDSTNNNKPAQRQTSSTSSLQNQNAKINQPQTQTKLLSSKANRLRSGSPKLLTLKEKQNNSSISQSASSNSTSTSDKTKGLGTQTKSTSNAITRENVLDIKDDSPNSTIDDFETMPTFTIVNVNDIINKKGDVLITKSKTNNNKAPTVIEFSESISLDDDDEMEDNRDADNEDEGAKEIKVKTKSNAVTAKQNAGRKLTNNKLLTFNNRKEFDNKKSPLNRSNESLKKLNTPTTTNNTKTNSTPAPQILNHKLGLRNANKNAKATTTLTATLKSPDKPAPRILNSMVAKKTQPVKPMIANMDDSADESFPLSLDEDEEEEEEQEHEEEEETEDEVESRGNRGHLMQTRKRQQQQRKKLLEVDNEDTESQNTEDEIILQKTNNNNKTTTNKTATSAAGALTPKQNQHIATQRRRRAAAVSNTPIVVTSNKKRLTPAASASTKENSLAATNQQVQHDTTTPATKSNTPALPPPAARKVPAEKVVISKQGDKIIKKITCFETWYVINMPLEPKRPTVIKNQLEMPLIRLANNAKNICLPNDLWSSKVTLYELSPQTLGKGTFVTYTGDLYEHNINEEDRGKYQPSCVMFRRSVEKNQITRMPYDRAVIFKNKTFYTNIEGKNVRLVGAPSIISTESEIEILLEVVDSLTLQSDFVEHISIVQ
ncbi:uncharacterized protein ACRADG_007118 isoform 1-T2 [Cochliomyia hominivorax]